MITNLKAIPNCIGAAVLDRQGKVLQSSGELENDSHCLSTIFQMTQDVNLLMKPRESFRRFTVSFETVLYAVTLTPTNLFVVKRAHHA
eukprot:NODE_6617_length_444_cov_95.468354_g5046_i0.p1 GENE.NODE_6617_length_444_cov_95.468354_g5046_i0~~NODE_6617_length_444_cov_95.468354_g5046_i0.p1  ORF type:complete len:88 (-),score=4.45 NODE_6617_length_444_cov_95.468354_g5046_i0:43-306(-)